MKRIVHWNVSRKARSLAESDVFFVSLPKSGRTWFRVFLFSYLCHSRNIPFTWDKRKISGKPRVTFTHDLWEQWLVPGWWDRIRGKHLIPPSSRSGKKIILLVRDPRDVVVSLYFHLTRRANAFRYCPDSISGLVRHPVFGVRLLVGIMNAWWEEWGGSPRLLVLRYEEVRADPPANMRAFLTFAGLEEIHPGHFQAALEFADFGNMQKMETSGNFSEPELAAGNPQDPDSFKARKGVVGGFVDYLSREDQAFCREEMKRLSPALRYGV